MNPNHSSYGFYYSEGHQPIPQSQQYQNTPPQNQQQYQHAPFQQPHPYQTFSPPLNPSYSTNRYIDTQNQYSMPVPSQSIPPEFVSSAYGSFAMMLNSPLSPSLTSVSPHTQLPTVSPIPDGDKEKEMHCLPRLLAPASLGKASSVSFPPSAIPLEPKPSPKTTSSAQANHALSTTFSKPPSLATLSTSGSPSSQASPRLGLGSSAVSLLKLPSPSEPANKVSESSPKVEITPAIQIPPRTIWAPRELKPDLENCERVAGQTWSETEKEALISYFQRDGTYAKMKVDAHKVWKDLEVFFKGKRTFGAIRSQWETMKSDFLATEKKINMTGAGIKDDEEWISIKEWAEKECAFYSDIADILQRDKSFAPPMASETGGKKPRITMANVTSIKTLNLVDSDEEESKNHPPQGGKKDPRAGKGKRNKRKRDNTEEKVEAPGKSNGHGIDRFSDVFAFANSERLLQQQKEFDRRMALKEREMKIREDELKQRKEDRILEREMQAERMRELEIRYRVQVQNKERDPEV